MKTYTLSSRAFPVGLLLVLMFLSHGLAANPAIAQNKLGAHFGVVLPIVTVQNGETTSIADNVATGFPLGITVKNDSRLAFDLEIVPFVDNHFASLLVHPGVLLGLGNGFTFGARAAFEINQSVYGVTPLLNKAFPLSNDVVGFVEFVLPMRHVEDNLGEQSFSTTAAIHIGVGF